MTDMLTVKIILVASMGILANNSSNIVLLNVIFFFAMYTRIHSLNETPYSLVSGCYIQNQNNDHFDFSLASKTSL